jgi:hypothetical protein
MTSFRWRCPWVRSWMPHVLLMIDASGGRVREVNCSLRKATQLLIGSELFRRSVSHRSTTRDAFTLVAHQQLHIGMAAVLSGQLTAE